MEKQKKRFKGLKFKLMGNILIMSLIPFFITILFSYLRIRQIELSNNEKYSKGMISQLNLDISNKIYQKQD